MAHLDLDIETWEELNRLLDTALDLPAGQRDAWLAALDSRHDAVKPRLLGLLSRAAEVETADFLGELPRLAGTPGAADAVRAGDDDARVGPYRLVRELGRGGMGAVWLGERADGLFSRPVALKFPRGAWIRAGLRERMARERAILASLEHPGIARLYDAGVTEAGDPYLALEYVEGQPLDVYCAEADPGVDERLALFLQIADAVAYAHGKLIVHRDLKPANVLVTSGGEVRLLDFGIGKLLDEQQPRDAQLTDVAGQAFTPDYASPEQVAGLPMTVATDIYSLGVILYELLAGQRPYRLRRASRGALEDAILEAQPRRPSQVVGEPALRKVLRGDLDAIVLRALKKTPQDRYPSVESFADDVRRYLAGRPVAARPDSAAYRFRKLVARHQLAAVASAVTCVAVIGAAGVSLWQAEMARAEARRAEDVTRFITSIFQGVDPVLLGTARPLSATDVLDQAQQRVATELTAQPELQTSLRAVIARSYLGLFEPRRARDLLASTLAEAERQPPSDAKLLRSLHLLMAQAMLELDDVDAAERHLVPVLGGGSVVAGADFVTAKVVESGIAYQRGHYDRAAEIGEEALEAMERYPQLDPVIQLDVYGSLGKAAGMQRRVEASLQYNRRAFDLALKAFGGDHDHPKVLESEHNYAASLIDVGRLEASLPHLERSLQAARATYGADSLIAARYAVRLGLVLMERGQLESAVALIGEANRIEGSFELGSSLAKAGRQRTLGRAYMAARRMAEAAGEIARALDNARAFDAPSVIRVLEADQAFALAASTGDLAPSIAQLASVIEAQDRGEQRYKTHLPDIYLGMVHLWNGDPARALPHLERGVALARDQTRVADLGEALSHLGLARLATGDRPGAEAALGEGLELLRTVQVVATPAQAEAMVGLGRVALDNGDPTAALEHLHAADGFWAGFDPDNRGAGEAAYWLAAAQSALRQTAAADTALQRAAGLLAASPLPADAALARLAGAAATAHR